MAHKHFVRFTLWRPFATTFPVILGSSIRQSSRL